MGTVRGQPCIASARFPDDLEAVRRAFRAYEAAVDAPACFAGFDRELAGLPGAYAPPEGTILLVRDAGGLVAGCVAVRGAAGGGAEIKRLFVAPEARGKGLGRRLMDAALHAALHAAQALGYRYVVLETHESMTEAMALYVGLGFAPVGVSADGTITRMTRGIA